LACSERPSCTSWSAIRRRRECACGSLVMKIKCHERFFLCFMRRLQLLKYSALSLSTELLLLLHSATRTRTNTNPNGTEANAAGRSGNARALRKQSKCGMIQEGEGHWPNSSKNLQKSRNLWVLRTPQNNKEEGARAKKLVTCGTRGPLGRGQSVPFSAQGAYCSAQLRTPICASAYFDSLLCSHAPCNYYPALW